MFKNLRARTRALLDPEQESRLIDRLFDYFIVFLIIVNVIAVILETVHHLFEQYEDVFHAIEYVSVIIFTIEYLLRIWTATTDHKYKHPFWGRLKFMVSIGAIIDLLAILPFYLPLFITLDLRSLRALRLFRFFRIFKLARYTKASRMIMAVVKEKREELFMSFLLTIFLIIMAATLMYYVEHEVQPDKFSNIPETMWWSVSTLTTVGYGDVVPLTSVGKVLTGFIALLGVGLIALPAGILASGFSDQFRLAKKKNFCPHCGEAL